MFCGMFEDIPVEYDSSARLVTIFDSLEHHRSPVDTLKTAWRVTDDNGFVFADVPNIDYAVAQHNIAYYDWFESDHLMYFSRASIIKAFEQAGFKNIETFTPPLSEHELGECRWAGINISPEYLANVPQYSKGKKLWCVGQKV